LSFSARGEAPGMRCPGRPPRAEQQVKNVAIAEDLITMVV
jgi:hypothetical protein